MWETLGRYGIDTNFIIWSIGMIIMAVMMTRMLNQVDRDNEEIFEKYKTKES